MKQVIFQKYSDSINIWYTAQRYIANGNCFAAKAGVEKGILIGG
jgi:hypothetical protein